MKYIYMYLHIFGTARSLLTGSDFKNFFLQGSEYLMQGNFLF